MFLSCFDCATDTGNVSRRCDFVLPYIAKFGSRFTKQIMKSRTGRENASDLLSIYLWIAVPSIGVV